MYCKTSYKFFHFSKHNCILTLFFAHDISQDDRSMSVQYFNRYTQQMETEAIYQEKWLRWAYETSTGRFAKHLLLKRPFFAKLYGWLMNRSSSKKKISPFIKIYQVDEKEFLAPAASFKNFNDFFTRHLSKNARPIHDAPKAVVFPADGRHLGFQNIADLDSIYTKGQTLQLRELFGSNTLADHYRDGTLVISRLCPTDYHRFHFPVSGTPQHPKLINGPLYSVNPIALTRTIKILWQNKRYLTVIESDTLGPVLMIEVGATCVGSVKQTAQFLEHYNKGDEKGYFEFGGSMTMLFFESNRIELTQDLKELSERGVELYGKMGDILGHAL